MAKIEFVEIQKHLGFPIVVAFDQEGKGLRRASILIPRKVFDKKEIPKRLRVTLEWNEEG